MMRPVDLYDPNPAGNGDKEIRSPGIPDANTPHRQRKDSDGGILGQFPLHSLQRLVDEHFLTRVEDETFPGERRDSSSGAGP